jgi:hypothetical protein
MTCSPRITVAIPILNRPARIVDFASHFEHPLVELLFLPDEADAISVDVLERAGLPYAIAPPAPAFGVPTYASKINHAYRTTNRPFLLYAGDDLRPRDQRGWPGIALAILRDDRIGLLSTNDQHHHLNRAGVLATHGIVRRAYVEAHGTASLPGSGPVFSEAYRHAGPDVEVSYVALTRGAFRHAPELVLEHHHWLARKSVRDSTYRLGQSFLAADRARIRARIPEWEHIKAHANHTPSRARQEAPPCVTRPS